MSTLAVNNITDVAGSLPPVFPAGSAQLNPLANREDRIINGDFGIWQRGTSGSTIGYVAADRWFNNVIGGTVTQSRIALAVGSTLGGQPVSAVLRQTVSGQSLVNHVALTQQFIEGVGNYAGQTITILGWASRSSGTGNMVVEAEQVFGSGGGSVSPAVSNIPPVTITLTSVMTPFAAVITIPTIGGKTLGTDNNDRLQINFWTSAGSNWNARTNSLGIQTIGVDLWGIHIRQGTWTAAATADYRRRDPATELALCYRYYEKSTIASGQFALTRMVNWATTTNSGYGFYTFKVTKRATPGVTYVWEINDVLQAGAMTTFAPSPEGVVFAHTTAAGNFIDLNTLSADAEL